MNPVAADSLAWSHRKLLVAVVVAVAAQLLLILWFSAQERLTPRTASPRPAIQLVAEAGREWLLLTDPTLFSRAHPNGFSEVAWLSFPRHGYRPADRGDVPMWFAPEPERMGAAFRDFVKDYVSVAVSPRNWQPPRTTVPSRLPPVPTFDSRVEVQGPLAARGIVAQPGLPSWTNVDVLGPSRVQVLVDARGNPISTVLLSSSGLKTADQSAVDIARRMSFGADRRALDNPVPGANDGLTAGWLLFSWRTLAPVTNGIVNPR